MFKEEILVYVDDDDDDDVVVYKQENHFSPALLHRRAYHLQVPGRQKNQGI
jgi:hypothetical protein